MPRSIMPSRLLLSVFGFVGLSLSAAPIPVATRAIPKGLVGVGMPAASFDRGYLLRINPYDAQGGDGLFFIGPADSVLKTVRLWPDGAAAVSVFDAAAMPDGSLIVASQAISTDEKRAYILYGVDSNGQVRFRVRTNPFAITHLVATDDNHIWALGGEPAAEITKSDYAILREYDSEGKLLRSYLPRSSFSSALAPSENHGGPDGGTRMLKLPDGVGLYISVTREWVEVDHGGSVRTKVQVGALGNSGFRLAALSSGQVYLQTEGHHICLLDRTNGECGSDVLGPADMLAGSDGNRLVFYSLGQSALHWFNPADFGAYQAAVR